jgi:hypothetical protein
MATIRKQDYSTIIKLLNFLSKKSKYGKICISTPVRIISDPGFSLKLTSAVPKERPVEPPVWANFSGSEALELHVWANFSGFGANLSPTSKIQHTKQYKSAKYKIARKITQRN